MVNILAASETCDPGEMMTSTCN